MIDSFEVIDVDSDGVKDKLDLGEKSGDEGEMEMADETADDEEAEEEDEQRDMSVFTLDLLAASLVSTTIPGSSLGAGTASLRSVAFLWHLSMDSSIFSK